MLMYQACIFCHTQSTIFIYSYEYVSFHCTSTTGHISNMKYYLHTSSLTENN